MVPTHQPMLPPVPGGNHRIPTSRCVSSARPPWVPVLEAPRWSQVRFLNGWRMGTRRLWDVDSFLKVLINRQTCGDLDFLIFFLISSHTRISTSILLSVTMQIGICLCWTWWGSIRFRPISSNMSQSLGPSGGWLMVMHGLVFCMCLLSHVPSYTLPSGNLT